MDKNLLLKPRILVVDDEESICEILQFNLEIEGYLSETASNAEEALDMIKSSFAENSKPYSLIILDVMMDGISGFRFAHNLKKDSLTSNIPIIFCTAKDSDDDKVTGFTIGADDYVTKPFSMREMMARVKNIIKRNSIECYEGYERIRSEIKYPSLDNNILKISSLEINFSTKICTIEGKFVNLTKKELEILILLLKNPGRIYSREELLELIWNNDTIVTDRTIDVNIARLRKKIGIYGESIVTRQGFGYGYKE